MAASPISASLLNIYKIGPGPSSSHMLGPWRAARDAAAKMQAVSLANVLANKELKIKVVLFGSLSATAEGHGTYRAIAAGLLGYDPETCDMRDYHNIDLAKPLELNIGGRSINFERTDFILGSIQHMLSYPNAIRIDLIQHDIPGTIWESNYYSVGGGDIVSEVRGEKPAPAAEVKLPYPFANMTEIKGLITQQKISLDVLLLANERNISGLDPDGVSRRLKRVASVMDEAVGRGLTTRGTLPGDIGLARKAPDLYERSLKNIPAIDGFLLQLNAYGMAAAEENAAGSRIVTAPTSGASGVLPAVLFMAEHEWMIPEPLLFNGLLTAAMIGQIVKHNASISGAEVGCQGEIGTATSMAAVFLAYIRSQVARWDPERTIGLIDRAAEIAMEHQLGLTCDPIGGFVQIPCIERNAKAAVAAYNAYLLAFYGDPEKHKIGFDQVIKAMLDTGRRMAPALKETAGGGLALIAKC